MREILLIQKKPPRRQPSKIAQLFTRNNNIKVATNTKNINDRRIYLGDQQIYPFNTEKDANYEPIDLYYRVTALDYIL